MAGKIVTPGEFFKKNNRKLMKFGGLVVERLSDEELINALAEKDLEKLAKVFKTVFEMLSENSGENVSEKLGDLIKLYGQLGSENAAEQADANEGR